MTKEDSVNIKLRGWKETTLGQISLKIGSGATPRGGANSYQEEGTSLIRSQNVLDLQFSTNGLAFINEEQANGLRNVIVETRDILLNITGDSVARTCIVPDNVLPARVNQHVAIVRADKEKAIPEYILYSLISQKEQLLSLSEVGATRKAITKGMIENFRLKLPPLSKQKDIAKVLSSLDDKIDLLHRQNQTLEQMAETIFRQWFVEEAHEGWERLLLEELCEIRNGYAFKSKDYREAGHIIVRTKDFEDGYIDISDPVFLAEELINNYKKFQLSRKELLLVMVGASLGKSVVVTRDILPALQNQNMWAIKAHNELHQFYLNYRVKDLIKENLHIASGSARSFFQKGSFYKFSVILPPDELLIKVNQHFEHYFKKIETNRTQIRTLTALRDTLMPKLMSGEVRVNIKEVENVS